MKEDDWKVIEERSVATKLGTLRLLRYEHPRLAHAWTIHLKGGVALEATFGHDEARAKRWYSVLLVLCGDG